MYLNKKEYKNMEKDYKKADYDYAKMMNGKKNNSNGKMSSANCSPADNPNYDYMKDIKRMAS